MQAIDTPTSILNHMHAILNAGYHGIIRYISPDTPRFPSKQLTADETAAIQSVEGMRIGLVFEKDPTGPDYFTASQAAQDAAEVLAVLGRLAVPASVPPFFSVDYDASGDDLAGPISAYFNAVHDQMRAGGYLIGVYGSGLACSKLKEAGVAHFTWLAQSTGWGGYADWKASADIVQGPSSTVASLSVDTDDVVNEAVLW